MKNKKHMQVMAVPYILSLLCLFSLIIVICVTRTPTGIIQNGNNYEDISMSWTLDKEGTKAVDIQKLGDYMNPDTGVLSIYYQLPALDDDIRLVYRSKDVYTRVLIGEDELYETAVYDSRFYNRSPGNLWNRLNISSAYSEQCLEIQIRMVYDVNAITVDSIYMGDGVDIVLGIMRKYAPGAIVSCLMIMMGIGLIIYDFLPIFGIKKRNHALAWIGVFALLTGIWSLLETNLLQFIVKDMRILQLVDNMLMVTNTIPLLLYLDCEYQILKNRYIKLLGYIGIGYTFFCVIMQYSGLKDFHHLLNGALLIMVLTDGSLLVWAVIFLIHSRKKKEQLSRIGLHLLGISALWIFTIFEVPRTLSQDRVDRAGLLRIGMLILSVCFAISSLIETYRIIEHGLKYDIISKLAYSDGLTGLSNRTAYMEQLEKYRKGEAHPLKLGIVFLDVNDLKKVNDNLGHEFGDQMIEFAAKIISDSFGQFGKPYRIGGDEFCVLIEGENPYAGYTKGTEIFTQLVNEANEANRFTYKVQIANGFALCESLDTGKIDAAIAEADSAMYRNKAELKKENA